MMIVPAVRASRTLGLASLLSVLWAPALLLHVILTLPALLLAGTPLVSAAGLALSRSGPGTGFVSAAFLLGTLSLLIGAVGWARGNAGQRSGYTLAVYCLMAASVAWWL